MASIPRVPTWSMAEACSGAVPAHVRFDRAEYSIQEIQATVPRAEIGIQCTLSFSVSEGSQTEKEFPVAHPGVGSGHLHGDLDAGSSEKSGTGSEGLSTQDVEIVETNIDWCTDQGSITAQCAVGVEVTPGTSYRKGRFVCHVCPYTADRKSKLTSHMFSHSKEKLFRCDVCSRSFIRRGHLMRHSAIHANEKRFKCSECPAEGFSSKADLSQHMYLHSGKKLFQCSICSRVLHDRANLARHMRIHRGEKPFKCEHCPLAFNQKSNLATHRRQHTGEMPFVCSVCSRMFTNKRSLQHHASTHK